jgi:hypothetical protein
LARNAGGTSVVTVPIKALDNTGVE